MEHVIVLYPAPGIGHIVSMVELGKLILRRGGGALSITVLLTTGSYDSPSTTSYIRRVSHTYPGISFRRFPSLHVDTSDPTRSRAAVAFDFIRRNAGHAISSLREISATCRVRAFVIDMFCTSALDGARELGIPAFYFFTSGASALAAYLCLPSIHERFAQSFRDLPGTVIELPGLPPVRATEMPEPTLDRADPAYHDMVYFTSHLPRSDGIIVNTFEDLEPNALKTLADGSGILGVQTPPVYPIGPLIAGVDDRAATEQTDGRQKEYMAWLDAQPPKTVVFLCFGSKGPFTLAQVREIAEGLEQSGQRFLWVVKRPSGERSKESAATEDFDLDAALPAGFRERNRARGRVVKSWAAQVEVLASEAVGGFVTHCGWNSVLEAVVAGVPMVAWPLYAEQHWNRAFLVEDMKMALTVEQREGDGFVSAAQLERSLSELMVGEAGRELRERSLMMKDIARSALEEQGSSVRALRKLIGLWKRD